MEKRTKSYDLPPLRSILNYIVTQYTKKRLMRQTCLTAAFYVPGLGLKALGRVVVIQAALL